MNRGAGRGFNFPSLVRPGEHLRRMPPGRSSRCCWENILRQMRARGAGTIAREEPRDTRSAPFSAIRIPIVPLGPQQRKLFGRHAGAARPFLTMQRPIIAGREIKASLKSRGRRGANLDHGIGVLRSFGFRAKCLSCGRMARSRHRRGFSTCRVWPRRRGLPTPSIYRRGGGVFGFGLPRLNCRQKGRCARNTRPSDLDRAVRVRLSCRRANSLGRSIRFRITSHARRIPCPRVRQPHRFRRKPLVSEHIERVVSRLAA